MFGQHINRQTGAVYSAFMEDDSLYTITTEVDGVEVNRLVIAEPQVEALLNALLDERVQQELNALEDAKRKA